MTGNTNYNIKRLPMSIVIFKKLGGFFLTALNIYNIIYNDKIYGEFLKVMNIALLTMSLNIGGAETHIFELALELKSRGNNVTVFSAGGVWADKLKQSGIEHVTAPLNKKDPTSLLKSYKLISDYVKNNSPCVIHSHTRISNFVSNLVCKKYNVPFVTTVHFNFSTKFFERKLSRWGNRAIAVSNDLKEYTANSYGYESDKISVTVNGINLNTFCKRENPELKAELGIAPDSKVILCVSRLDEVAGDHVLRVLQMSEQIYKQNPNTNIVIVGNGTRFDEFLKLANSVNAVTKDGFIKLVGPQTDIYRFCNIADLFIGISRAALEAMACKVPTILLGNSGYIGLYSKDTEKQCIETNFTCRNCPYPSQKVITDLIDDMLNNPQNYEQLVKDGYEIVKNKYSVAKMADDALLAYAAAKNDKRPYDIMLCGYYGRHNLGDDLSLEALVSNLKTECGVKRGIVITADTKTNYGDLTPVHRFNIFKILRLMKKTKLFILGSGSILQDATSSRSMVYYLHILKHAIKRCPKTMLYSNGIGPIRRNRHRKRAATLLSVVDHIAVRDQNSFDYLEKMGVINDNITVTADETFTISKDNFKTEYPLQKNKRYICVNLRARNISEQFLCDFAKFLDDVCKQYALTPLLVPVHYKQDLEVLYKFSKKLKVQSVLITNKLEHHKTLSIISQCEFAILERLHAVIFSSIFGLPFMAINYDPKVLSHCTETNMEQYMLSLDNFDKDTAVNTFEALYNNRDNISNQLLSVVNNKYERAKGNAQIANSLLSEI